VIFTSFKKGSKEGTSRGNSDQELTWEIADDYK